MEGVRVAVSSRSMEAKSGTPNVLISELFNGVATDVVASLFSSLGKNALRPTAMLSTVATLAENLTLDKGFQKQDNDRGFNRQTKGFMSSARIARKQVFNGMASGVRNLYILPLRGAREGGVSGAVKGFGRGVVGLAVKPIAGMARGIATVSQGASISYDRKRNKHGNTGIVGKLSKTLLRERKRLPRHFSKRTGYLTPYDQELSLAAELLLRTVSIQAKERVSRNESTVVIVIVIFIS